MHHRVRLKTKNLKKLRLKQISQYFFACRQYQEALVTYLKNEVEALDFFDLLEGPIYISAISSQGLWKAWIEAHTQKQIPGWIASRFEDGQFWASRWELHYLDVLDDLYPEINEQMGFNCAGVFYLFNLVNQSLLLPCTTETTTPGADDKTL